MGLAAFNVRRRKRHEVLINGNVSGAVLILDEMQPGKLTIPSLLYDGSNTRRLQTAVNDGLSIDCWRT